MPAGICKVSVFRGFVYSYPTRRRRVCRRALFENRLAPLFFIIIYISTSRFSCHAEDQISGTYNGVKFNLSEAISIPRDAKLKLGDSAALNLLSAIVFVWKMMKDIQAFSGSVLVCEFYKKFSGQTIVANRTLNTKFLGEKEQMDDTFFNDEFRVFTDDKVEARYLLTPAFMVRLRELKIKFAGDMGVSAAFMDDKFYLFLNGAKNRFETTLFSIPPSLEDAKQIKKEISELLSIIDELNLSLDIFKQEVNLKA